jgi:hypothetical protein
MAVFEARITLPCSQREAFDFLLRPANVALISPPQLGLHFIEAPEIVVPGSRLRFRIHDHLFETNSQGETVVIDQIDFETPGGILGLLVTKDRVLDQLEEAFDHRHSRLSKLLKKNV